MRSLDVKRELDPQLIDLLNVLFDPRHTGESMLCTYNKNIYSYSYSCTILHSQHINNIYEIHVFKYAMKELHFRLSIMSVGKLSEINS